MQRQTQPIPERPDPHDDLQEVRQRVHALLERLERASFVEEARRPVTELRTLLALHFEGEERPGGLFDELVARWPPHADAVLDRRREHEALLAEIAEIDVAMCRNDRARASQLLRAFTTHLQDHEAAEGRLIAHAWSQDLGAGD